MLPTPNRRYFRPLAESDNEWEPWSTERERFLGLVLASQLLDFERLTAAIQGLAEATDVSRLCKHLVARGALTRWQCERLRLGKYKGFFLKQFKLLDCQSRGEPRRYLAEDWQAGQKVMLLVRRNSSLPGGIECRVLGE
jgi:eukaryotic-like serine/threonine-protein kinase